MSATETLTIPTLAPAATKQTYAFTSFELPSRSERAGSQSGGQSLAQSLTDTDSRDLPTPNAVEALERWNYPRSNLYGVLAAYLSLFVIGMNDATPGALIPYLEQYYDLSYTVVSLLFLSPCFGFSLAAAMNNSVHRKFGQRGIAFIVGLCHVVTYLTLSLHPPYPVIVVFMTLTGFGNGLADAGYCAWTGNMASANQVQGFLHACYSLGATVSPLVATTMITKGGLQWYSWYYVMAGAAVLEWVICTTAFWKKDGARYRVDTKQEDKGSSTWAAAKNKVTLICGAFFLIYVGAEVALGGWVVTFMLKVRQASPYASGLSVTGFWAGMTVGRAVLGFVTERFGERICVSIYLAIAVGLELIFWLVPKFVVSAIAVAFLGFFFGPIFPGGVVMCAKLLPKHMHVSALGAATAVAGIGGAGIPFAVGAIAQKRGVWVLQPIVLALVSVLILLWLSLPRVKKRSV